MSPLHTKATPGAGSPLIQVLAVGGGADRGRPPPVAAVKVTAATAVPKAAGTAPPVAGRRSSTMRGSVDPTSAHNDARRAEPRDGWSAMQYCMRGTAAGRDMASDAPTHPVCVFNPAVVLGDATGAADSSGRRVILDATVSLVPYEGAAGRPGSVGDSASGDDDTTWSVCVAATYGAKVGAVNGVGGGVGGGDGAAGGSGQRRSSLESTALGTDVRSSRSAEAAVARVRAAMDCGYPWGSASATQTTVPGSTMETALRVARESPGLVLAWFMVPLPPNSVPQKDGTLYADVSTSGGAAATAAASSSTEYVVVVVPLVCDSEVTTLLAHPFQPSTLLGGTRCGRVVQWSVGQTWAQVEPRRLIERALATTGTATTLLLPPQRPTHSSFPSPQAHQGPVLRMAIHGDVSCHHLYSISQEGKVCTWPAWQPLHPTASCLSYLGIRPMGNIGVAARFVERPGTDAMTQVFIGTSSGAVLVGANRDAKSIELQYYGPPRPVPTSTTVIKTLDVTACPPAAVPTAGESVSPTANSMSVDSSVGLGSRNATAAPAGGADYGDGPHALTAVPLRRTTVGPTATPGGASSSSPAPSPIASLPSPPQPHHGRVVSMSLQTATHGFRGQDYVVSAATDGSCVAWFAHHTIPLEGFSSAVTSVCWSPTKSGVLAAGDAGGLVTVWAVNTSIVTPVATVSLCETSRRTRGSATSDAVLWVVSGPSDAAGMDAGNLFFDNPDGAEDDDADVVVGGGAEASLGQTDTVGVAVSSVFFSRDGRWLFASTACGYVYSMRLSASLA
jgi:hypothetical protein